MTENAIKATSKVFKAVHGGGLILFMLLSALTLSLFLFLKERQAQEKKHASA